MDCYCCLFSDEAGDRVVLTHALPTGTRLFIHRDSKLKPTLRRAAPLSAHSTDSRGKSMTTAVVAAAVVGFAAIIVALQIGWLPATLDAFHRQQSVPTKTALTSADPRDEPAIEKEIATQLPGKCTSGMPADKQRACAFESVARNGAWMLGGEQSMSGPGSSLSATKAVREWLDAIVKDHGIRHILDLGCGDGHWQAEIQSLATPNAADGQVMYLGLDISTTALKKARERHAQKPFMKWAVADMAAENTTGLEDLLQQHIATEISAKERTSKPLLDLVVVRDVFQHMKHDDVRRTLRNLKRVGFRWLAASSLRYSTENKQMDEGVYLKGQGYYDANLQIPPFGLAPARRWLHDRKYGADSQHPMAVWERRRYGERGPPMTHPSEKYVGLWHFDDVPTFEH